MKQIIFGLMLFCLCFYAGAQKIKKMEYFFDADPGVGKAKPFPVSAADTITLNTSIPINNLQQGLHNLYVRAKTDTGWGLTESFLFSIYDSALARSVTREEYFFDSDPGIGNAIGLPVTEADTLLLEQTLPTGSLTEGLHTLYMRVANAGGYYSHTENALFYVTGFAANAAKISAAEYFIDTDPGVGKAKKLTTGSPADTLRTTYNINVPAGLDTAVSHYLCIRVKDANGVWSLYQLDTFKINAPAHFTSLKINAERNGSKANIFWSTGNNDAVNYTAEKSIDGIDFTVLGNITSKGKTYTYSTKDLTPLNGVNFYRIRQTNVAGDISYSNIVKLLFNEINTTGAMLYPNPAKGFVNIRFATTHKTVLINLFDAAGRNVKFFNLPATENMQLNVSSLTAGTYLLQISDGEKTETGKLIKQ